MLWLIEQGHEVVGIELSPIATEAFFRENQLNVKKQRIGRFVRWRAKGISIWCGDFFSLTSKQLGRIDAVFDRAALTALPPEVRAAYVRKLMDLTEQVAPILLFTLEDIQTHLALSSPPIDKELAELCEGHYDIELLYSEVAPQPDVQLQEHEVSFYKVYRLAKCN
jgi:thiopurine S-methyltransferase